MGMWCVPLVAPTSVIIHNHTVPFKYSPLHRKHIIMYTTNRPIEYTNRILYCSATNFMCW